MPQQRKNEESKRLRGERDQIKCMSVVASSSPNKAMFR